LLGAGEGDEEAARFFLRLRLEREPRAIVQPDEDHVHQHLSEGQEK
jgi:hypothetical protein